MRRDRTEFKVSMLTRSPRGAMSTSALVLSWEISRGVPWLMRKWLMRLKNQSGALSGFAADVGLGRRSETERQGRDDGKPLRRSKWSMVRVPRTWGRLGVLRDDAQGKKWPVWQQEGQVTSRYRESKRPAVVE